VTALLENREHRLRVSPQALDERVDVPARLGDAGHLQRVEDERAVGAPGHWRDRRAGPAEHRPEHHVIQVITDAARVQQCAVHVPEHKEIPHQNTPKIHRNNYFTCVDANGKIPP
jgi:hypothetical protein